jgi:type I restriction enzyme S subunit
MKMVPLENVAEVQLGKMLSPISKTGKTSFPYLRNQNIQWDRIDLNDLAMMDFSPSEQVKFELKAGDLLVCEGGEPGRCAIWNDEISHCYFQKAIHRVRPKTSLSDSAFLSLWIRFQCLFGELANSNSRTTIAHLPLTRLKKLPVPGISIEEQKQIVENYSPKLEYVTRGITALRTQMAELSKLSHSILIESLSQKSNRLLSIGESLVEIKNGIGPSWQNYPVLGATRAGLAPARERPGKNAERYKPVTTGTVFYNPMRILIGSIAFVDEDDEPGITSPDYVVLKGKPGVVDSRWFYYWLRSPLGERCIQSLARGAVRERMLFNRLAEGEIELPDYETQVKASRALAQIKPMRAAIEKQIAELDLLPQKLLAQVFEPHP